MRSDVAAPTLPPGTGFQGRVPQRTGVPGLGSPGPWHILSAVLWVLLLAALAFHAAAFLRLSLALIRYPFDWTESDGNVLIAVRLMEQGRAIYEDPARFPMLPDIYPPAYPFAVYLLTRLFGDSLSVARSVSLAATLGLALLVYRTARGAGASRPLSWVAALLLFTFPAGTMDFGFAKPDALFCLLLSAGFLLIPWASTREGHPARLAAPLALFLAAALTKHSGLPAAAVAAVAIGTVDLRRGALFSAAFAVLTLGAVALLELWSDGWFYHDVYGFAATYSTTFPLEWERLSMNYLPFLISVAAPVAASFAVFARIRPFRLHTAAWLPFLLFGLAWAVQTGRNGLAPNHCLPGVAAASLAFAFAAGNRWSGHSPSIFDRRSRGGAVLAALLLAGILLPVDQLHLLRPPTDQDRRSWERVVDFMKAVPGPVLVDYAGGAAIASGKWEYATDSVNLYFGSEDRRAMETLIPLVEKRRFDALILYEHTFFPEELKGAVRRRYRLLEKVEVGTADPDNERFVLVIVPDS